MRLFDTGKRTGANLQAGKHHVITYLGISETRIVGVRQRLVLISLRSDAESELVSIELLKMRHMQSDGLEKREAQLLNYQRSTCLSAWSHCCSNFRLMRFKAV